MELISKQDAILKGLSLFFTGKPCRRGGIGPRSTNHNKCRCEYCMQADRDRQKAKLADEAVRAGILRRRKLALQRADLKAKAASRNKAYKNANRASINAEKAKRRAIKRMALPRWFGEIDQLVAEEAADLAKIRTDQTGVEWHVDHMIPLQARSACGLHCAANLQVIPAKLNIAKKNKLILTRPFEWINTNSAT